MCTNRQKVTNKYVGRSFYVDCGHCPACLQRKANKSCRKIISEYGRPYTFMVFVTLSYDNEHIPYIHPDTDYTRLYVGKPYYVRHSRIFDDKGIENLPLSVYRNGKLIDTVFLPEMPKEVFRNYLCNTTGIVTKSRNGVVLERDDSKVGILYDKDFVNFVKRLRINLTRNYNYEGKITYFKCSEYGPTTHRPHFHGIFWFDSRTLSFDSFRSAVVESWKMCDEDRQYENVEIAREPASYVASYVNCLTSVPPLFLFKGLRPKHSHSKGFGFANNLFSFSSVFTNFMAQRLTGYFVQSLDAFNVAQATFIPYPKYIVDKYIPHFTGMHRLSQVELFNVLSEPRRLSESSYRTRTFLTDGSIELAKRNIENRYSIAKQHGIDRFTWSKFCCDFLVKRASDLLKNSHIYRGSEIPVFYCYDNIKDYYSGYIRNDFLDEQMKRCPDDFNYITDTNDFYYHKIDTKELIDKFYKKEKQRKVAYIVSLN